MGRLRFALAGATRALWLGAVLSAAGGAARLYAQPSPEAAPAPAAPPEVPRAETPAEAPAPAEPSPGAAAAPAPDAGSPPDAQANPELTAPSAPVSEAHGAPEPAPNGMEPPPATTGVFVDPELAALESAQPNATTTLPSIPSGPTARVRFVLRSRFGVDLHVEDAYQDRYEATQLALLEASIQQTPSLRYELGLRMSHRTFVRDAATPEAEAMLLELDAVPTSGFVDWSILPTVHLRAGYQQMHLGRFDMLGASDMLSVYDLRWGPTAMPEAVGVGQLAVRVDVQPTQWLTIGVYYVPFFTSHLVDVYGTDYALFQPDPDAAATLAGMSTAGQQRDARIANRLVRENLTRAAQTRTADTAFSAFAPDPDLSHGQAALRVDARAGQAEFGLTAGTALEKLPAVDPSQSLLDYWEDPDSIGNELALIGNPNPLSVLYNRYGTIAVDAAHPLGPVLLGVELAYMFKRTLLAAQTDEWALPEQVDMTQAAVRAEYVLGQTLLVGLEGFFAYTLDTPSDPARAWFSFAEGRYFAGGAGLVGWSVFETGLSLELGGGLFTGPSYVIAPRAEYRIVGGLSAEVGAYFVGGAEIGAFGSPTLAIGGLYDDIDQVFLGLRWVP